MGMVNVGVFILHQFFLTKIDQVEQNFSICQRFLPREQALASTESGGKVRILKKYVYRKTCLKLLEAPV